MTEITARSLRFHALGEPLDVLTLDQVVLGDPGAGQVRIRVAATGLNPADWEVCRGFLQVPPPRGIGFDVAGTVDAVGDGVTGVAVGDLVFGSADVGGQPSGGAADAAILSLWFPVPDGLDAVDAAVLTMVLQTAVWTLDMMGVKAGETILIHGAGGMVGYTAVQVAAARGARVVATAGPTFASDLEGFGAAVTGYGDGMVARVRDLVPDGMDHVLDVSRPAAGTIARLVEIAGDASRVVTISNHDEARAAGARVNIDELLATGAFPSSDFLPEYAARAVSGAFRIPVARVVRLDRWREAAELSLSGAPHGKVVLVP
jgi:NADPH:quinone reductase-like Zn-dependent oxidoreductase